MVTPNTLTETMNLAGQATEPPEWTSCKRSDACLAPRKKTTSRAGELLIELNFFDLG